MKLQIIEISKELFEQTLIHGTDKTKDIILNKMNIKRDPKDTYLQAYLRHISEINNIEFTTPTHLDITNLINEDIDAKKLVILLA